MNEDPNWENADSCEQFLHFLLLGEELTVTTVATRKENLLCLAVADTELVACFIS